MALSRSAKPPTPAELVEKVRKDLDVAELRLAQCLRAQSGYAEKSITDPSAVKDYDEATRSVELVRGEIDRLKLALATAEQKAREAEAARVAKEKADRIARIEGKYDELVAAGIEMAEAVKREDAAFRRMLTLGNEIAAAWSWPVHDLAPCLLTPPSVLQALQHERFRVGARPFLVGGQDKPGAGLHLPGGKPPRLELAGRPDAVTPLLETVKTAAACAREILKTGKSTSGRAIPAGAADGVPIAMRKERPPLSPAEAKLAALLKDQAAAAVDMTPEGERKYQQIIAEISATQAEIAAQQGAQP